MNGNGTIVVEYTYDAWGYIRNTTGTMATTLGKANALRYRSYVYDTETARYYLQSRYYNPGTGRFLCSDTFLSTGQGMLGNNMYAYCLNNPINMFDYAGTDAIYISKTSGEESLPVVGHAVVYIQDADGNWYVTEYIGSNKKNARIRTRTATEEELELIDRMLQNEDISGLQYTYIKGDFSDSVKLAIEYNSSDYGGYCLFTNNCLHYAKEILAKGKFDDPVAQIYAVSSSQIVPIGFHMDLAYGHMRGKAWDEKGVIKYACLS